MPTRNPARDLTPPFSYNPKTGRYTDSRGKFVAAETVRAAVNTVLEASQERQRNLSQQLQNGTISLADWQRGMAQEIRSSHSIAAATANGGWAQMDRSEWGKVGNKVKKELKYLNKFAADIEAGRVNLDGRFRARADLYVTGARQTYAQSERAAMGTRGKTQERNVLGAADHCPGCLEASGEGWVDIGTLTPIGARDCMSRCHCHMEYK